MILVSACLAGINCRYDCASKTNINILKLVENGKAIPVCPEQLGGLPTPRVPAERVDSKVISIDGNDLTENYTFGAQETLNLVKLCNIKKAYLKSNSPMCGCGKIYDGTFSKKLKMGDGVLSEQLKKLGIEITSID